MFGGVATGTGAPGGPAVYPPSPALAHLPEHRSCRRSANACGSLRSHGPGEVDVGEGEFAYRWPSATWSPAHLDSDLVGVYGLNYVSASPNSYVELLIPGASVCDLTWK